MVYGWAAYAIAHKNTQFVFKVPEPKTEQAPKPRFWRLLLSWLGACSVVAPCGYLEGESE